MFLFLHIIVIVVQLSAQWNQYRGNGYLWNEEWFKLTKNIKQTKLCSEVFFFFHKVCFWIKNMCLLYKLPVSSHAACSLYCYHQHDHREEWKARPDTSACSSSCSSLDTPFPTLLATWWLIDSIYLPQIAMNIVYVCVPLCTMSVCSV